MDVLKKHYEKILLGIVLLGLAVGTAFLPIMISSERSELEGRRTGAIRQKINPLPEPDLTRQNEMFKRADVRVSLNLADEHKLFNPLMWGKRTDGGIVKMEEGNVGPKAVVVTTNSPLYTTISFNSSSMTESGPRYIVGIQREASARPADRAMRSTVATLNSKNEFFILRGVKGPPEDPSELILELNDTGETVSVAKDKPFRRVDGYIADLAYPPERRTWKDRRKDMTIQVAGEDYIIVAITASEVVLSAKSNNKKTPIPYKSL